MRIAITMAACLVLAGCPEDTPTVVPDGGGTEVTTDVSTDQINNPDADATTGDDGTPDGETTTGDDGTPDGETTTGDDGTPDGETTIGDDGTPDGETTIGDDGTPDGETTIGDDGTPDGETTIGDDGTPDGETTLGDDGTPDGETTLGDDGTPDGETTLGDDGTPDGDDGETTSTTEGDTCANAFTVDALPFSAAGDTTGFASDYNTGVCDPNADQTFGQDAPDVVYAFTPTATGNYTANLENATTGPPVILVVTTDCSGAGGLSACAGASNMANGPAVLNLIAGTTYYFIIDSFDTDAGSYTFTLEENCIPDCTGIACGADPTCGLSCGGCAAGEACDDTNTCVDVSATPGDTCANPNVVGALPATLNGDTSGLSNANQWTPGTCGTIGSFQSGLETPDEVWQLDATVEGAYTFTLASDADLGISIYTDCADPSGTCFAGVDAFAGGTDEVLTTDLAAGTYFIVVDGFEAGEVGAYTLTIDEPCVPTCGANNCGGDGCGGSCGTCVDGEFCQAGTCGAVTGGDTCGDALVVDAAALPWTFSYDTSALANDYSAGGTDCEGLPAVGGGSNDAVFTFTPTQTAVYNVLIDGYDSATYITTDCADLATGCVAGVDAVATTENVSASLEAGTQYFIIVDGWDNTDDVSGAFDITVSLECVPDCTDKFCGDDGCGGSCGVDCPVGQTCNDEQTACVELPGDSCAAPIVIDALPFTQDGDTSNAGNAYSFDADTCGSVGYGASANDLVFSFTPDTTGYYPIDSDADFDHAIYVTTNCDDISADTCLGAADSGDLELLLDAGTTYFIIVDAWGTSTASGTFTMNVGELTCSPDCTGKICGSDGCGGTCGDGCPSGEGCNVDQTACETLGGNTCSEAIMVGALPYTQDADTSIATNDYSFEAGTCGGFSYGASANDLVFAFTPDTTAYYPIESSAAFDHAIYITTDCDAITADSCLGAADSGDLEPLLEAGTTYYIIVDAWGTSTADGTFTMNIDAASCVPSCDGKVCGDDGCGGECLPGCGPGQACDDTAGTCADVANDACETATALVLDTPVSGDTSATDINNDYAVENGQCGAPNIAFGASGDMAYAFTPDNDGLFTFSLTPTGFTGGLALVRSCDDFDNTCLAAAEGENDDEVVSFGTSLLAGVTYYIIVDGSFSSDEGAFDLEVTTCTPDCAGKACGDDGCGGVCGDCAANELCDDTQQCITAPPGNTCADAIVIDSFPYTLDADTSIMTNDYNFVADTCGTFGYGAAANDLVFSITPTVTGLYSIDSSASFDHAIYVTTDCDDISATSCLGAADSGDIELTLDAGTTYYIIVDAWGTSSADGTFTMNVAEPCVPACGAAECGLDPVCGAIECGTCDAADYCAADNTCQPLPAGDSCADTLTLSYDDTSGTGTISGTTEFYTPLYDATGCPGASSFLGTGSNDGVHEFTAGAAGDYTFSLVLDVTQFDGILYVTDSPCDTGTCLGYEDVISDGGEVVTVTLTAGQVVYVFVDGWSNSSNQSGPYQLDVAGPTTP